MADWHENELGRANARIESLKRQQAAAGAVVQCLARYVSVFGRVDQPLWAVVPPEHSDGVRDFLRDVGLDEYGGIDENVPR